MTLTRKEIALHEELHHIVLEIKIDQLLSRQRLTNSKLTLTNSKLNKIMATQQERFDLLVARLDTISNDIAADYAQLLKAVQDGTVNKISEESFAAHEANIAKLEALGASVENPVPPVEPPAEPPV